MTDTVSLLQLPTYTCEPDGCTATPNGLPRTGMLATTVFVAASITDTTSVNEVVTYANGAACTGVAANTAATMMPRTLRNPRVVMVDQLSRWMARSGMTRRCANWACEAPAQQGYSVRNRCHAAGDTKSTAYPSTPDGGVPMAVDQAQTVTTAGVCAIAAYAGVRAIGAYNGRAMPRAFVLPDLGEGLTEAEIRQVLV